MGEDVAVIIGAVVVILILFIAFYIWGYNKYSAKEPDNLSVDNVLRLEEVTASSLQEASEWESLSRWGITWSFELTTGKFKVKISDELYTFVDYDSRTMWSLRNRAESLEHAICAALTEVARVHNDPSLLPMPDSEGMAKSAQLVKIEGKPEGGTRYETSPESDSDCE